jgi:hypothetical protein
VLPQVHPLTKRTVKSDHWLTGGHRCIRIPDTKVTKQCRLSYSSESVTDLRDRGDDASAAGECMPHVEHARTRPVGYELDDQYQKLIR